MDLTDDDIGQITIFLSPERLAALKQLTGSVRTAIELHQQTLNIGASLMTVIATVEIALRNTICENLNQHFGAPGWLLAPPAPFEWRKAEKDKAPRALDSARRAEYSKMSQVEKAALDALAFPNGRPEGLTHLKRSVKRREQIVVTEGKIIAELTLYFWKRLYGPDYEQTLWRTTLKKTFPFKKIKRADVAGNLENIYQARNRLAHHEPVLHNRFSAAIDSIQFVVNHLCAPDPGPNTPLAHLVARDIANVKLKATVLHERLEAFHVKP